MHPPYRFSSLNEERVTAHVGDGIGEAGSSLGDCVLGEIWLGAERSHWIAGLNNS